MKRERDTQTIEAEMRKEQKSLKKAQDRIRSLNAELTTAKKREKARRYTEIGSAIEDVLGVGELSKHDLCFLSSENPHFHHENSPSSSGKFPHFQRGHQDAVLTAASCRMSACSMR